MWELQQFLPRSLVYVGQNLAHSTSERSSKTIPAFESNGHLSRETLDYTLIWRLKPVLGVKIVFRSLLEDSWC